MGASVKCIEEQANSFGDVSNVNQLIMKVEDQLQNNS